MRGDYIRDYRRPSEKEIREKLTDIEYHVTQREGTELPFSHKYNNEFGPGIYVDKLSGEPLFSSKDKFDAGCGWPSFIRPIEPGALEEKRDNRYGLERTEVRSVIGDSHLGHVFPDGPRDYGGLRYCINGVALKFIPLKDLEREGYADYKVLFEEDI